MEAFLEKLSGFPGFALALVGAFYVFASLVLARQIVLDRVLSHALGMITLEKQSRIETHRQVWMGASAVLVGVAGVSLVMQSMLAVWLFCAVLMQQVAYLTWLAPRYFDREEEPDPVGRKQTTNAAILFGAATLGVIAAASAGKLLPVFGAGAFSSLATAAAAAAFAFWIIKQQRMPTRGTGGFAADEPDAFEEFDATPLDLASVDGLRLDAEWYESPVLVIHADGGRDFHPAGRLGLSDALADDLEAWQHAFTAACENDGDDMVPVWAAEARDAHFARAEDLALRMSEELQAAGLARIEVSWKRADGEIVVVA